MNHLDTEIFQLFFCGDTSTCRRAVRRCWRRRGQILPRGAPPEVIGAQAHRWTYAVFVAALLRDLPQVSHVMRVWTQIGVGVYRAWSPSEGSMRVWGALGYGIQILQPCAVPQTLDPNIALRLFEPSVPALDAVLQCLLVCASSLRFWGSGVRRWEFG
ncbi:MAG: TraI domain-containing protein [Rhodoferax sp.]|nr:TraI domain-containing protein [Rhodoferax sp.]